MLFFIHRAHVKRLRREEKNDKDFDMDLGVGDLPPAAGVVDNVFQPGFDGKDTHSILSLASVKDDELQPPPKDSLPYLVPKATMSRESLQSLSDPRDNPYGAIITSSAPPSPGGAYSPFSDQASIRSNKNLLPPVSHAESYLSDGHIYKQAVTRVPSPLAITEIPQLPQSEPPRIRTPSPPKELSTARNQNRSITPTRSPAISPVETRRLSPGPESDLHSVSSREPSPARSEQPQRTTQESSLTSNSTSSKERFSPLVLSTASADLNLSSYVPEERTSSRLQTDLIARETAMTREPENPKAGNFIPEAEPNHSVLPRNEEIIEEEPEEDRAKRIQSVYKEYYGDSQYYDGSEDWEPLPPHARQNIDDYSEHSIPAEYEPQHRDTRPQEPYGYRENSYYEDDWQSNGHDGYYHSRGYSEDRYSQDRYDDYERGRMGRSPGPYGRFQSPPPPPRSIYSNPSGAYSTSSLQSRNRLPLKPLDPLNDLPKERYKLDDLASPISFAKPRRFANVGSPGSRPSSPAPAQVLSSSWSNLADLPQPHRLRKSGSFSSLDFAPMRKFATGEVDMGDTASVRSLARTEISLMAVSAGAGRVNRIPQSIVPLGKSGALASLRPQDYSVSHRV